MEARSNKLQAKDLINVGIFTAIYFVIFFAGMMLGYIPIFIPLLGLVCPILCGIPFMLYLTKVKKFGMVSLTVEETNLLSIYNEGGKRGLMENINAALPFMDEDMRELAKRTLAKIAPLTENEYTELAIFAADEV